MGDAIGSIRHDGGRSQHRLLDDGEWPSFGIGYRPRFFFTPSTWNEMDEVGAFNDRLAARNTVIHLDHRGYGLSDPATVPAPMDDLIADIDAVVDGLGLEHIALLGQTFSTALAINYAVQRPGRLSHLILWCGITSWDEYIQAPQAQTLAVVREQGDWHTFTETVWQVI